MKIIMLKDTRGSDDHLGRFVRMYREGEELVATEPWQVDLYRVFVDTHRAKEVATLSPGTEIETPESGPIETKEGDGEVPPIIPANTPWNKLRAYARKLSGQSPKTKPEALEAIRKAGRLAE